jgi:hypothetical protein
LCAFKKKIICTYEDTIIKNEFCAQKIHALKQIIVITFEILAEKAFGFFSKVAFIASFLSTSWAPSLLQSRQLQPAQNLLRAKQSQ